MIVIHAAQLADVMVPPTWTVPPAILAGLGLAWYWFWLGGEDVPPSRRRLRRITIVLLAASLPVLVRALSFLSADQQPREFIMSWSIAAVLMMVVILFALLDAINSLRLHQQAVHEEMHDATQELIRVAQARKEEEARQANADKRHHSQPPHDS